MVPFVFSILPSRKQQLVLSLASSIRPATAVAASIFLHSAFYVLSHPIPVRSLPSGGGCNFAVKKRRPQFPSPLLSSPLSSFFPNSPAYFSGSRLASVSFGRGEEGRKRRRDDGAERKCLLCKRWSEKQNGKEKRATPSGGRASKRPNGS